jgi:hypothetical protein
MNMNFLFKYYIIIKLKYKVRIVIKLNNYNLIIPTDFENFRNFSKINIYSILKTLYVHIL